MDHPAAIDHWSLIGREAVTAITRMAEFRQGFFATYFRLKLSLAGYGETRDRSSGQGPYKVVAP